MTFSAKILSWYTENKRDLPWRASLDPYKIWLSEVILQQTRVAQGTPYYLRFVEKFPTVQDLAAADEETILKLWQGLGYYSRARNLHTAAKMVMNEFGGTFPSSYKDLLRLKGVGDYTASAISSICFNEQQAVVDGNVYRVLARYFNIATPINSTEGIKYFKKLATELLHKKHAGDYNQALMEFGAIQCVPANPYCLHCPLQDSCKGLERGAVKDLPVKLKKGKVKKRYFNYLVPVFTDGNNAKHTLLTQRKGKGIWQNLWEFPLLESDKEVGTTGLDLNKIAVLQKMNKRELFLYNNTSIVHKLSHQHLYAKFWIVPVNESFENSIDAKKLATLPVPALLVNFIKAFKF